MSEDAYSEFAAAEADEAQDAQWERVHVAILRRWPHINRDELRSCEARTQSLIEFVRDRVEASSDEIESVVTEFAPESRSTFAGLASSLEEQYQRVTESIETAYRHTEKKLTQQIEEHPKETTALVFFTGVAVGVLTTAMFFASRPRPTVWQNMRENRWRG